MRPVRGASGIATNPTPFRTGPTHDAEEPVAGPACRQRRRVHARRQGHPGAEGLAPGVRADGGRRRLEHDDHAELASSSRRRPACSSPPRTPTASPTSSTAAARRASCGCSTSARSDSPTCAATASTSPGQSRGEPQGPPLPDRLRPPAADRLWGEARVVENDAALLADHAGGWQVTRRAGPRIPRAGLGRQLPSAHSAALRCGRRRAGARGTRPAHRRARSGGRTIVGRPGLTPSRDSATAPATRSAEAALKPCRDPTAPCRRTATRRPPYRRRRTARRTG